MKSLIVSALGLFFIFGLCNDRAQALIIGDQPLTIRVERDANNNTVFSVINLKIFNSCEDTVNWCWLTHENTKGKETWYQNSVYLEFQENIVDAEIQEICAKFIMGKIYPLKVQKFSDMEHVEFKMDKRQILRQMFPEGIPKDVLERLEKKEANRAKSNHNFPEK